MTESYDRTENALRAALHEAVDQLDVAPATSLDDEPVLVPTRSRRGRLLAVAAAIAVLAIAVGGVIALTSGGGTSRITSGADDTTLTTAVPGIIPLPNANVEVWMKVDATSAQVDSVRAVLAKSSAVSMYVYVDKTDAYSEFERAFACNTALIQTLSPSDMPTDFRIVTTADAAAQSDLEVALQSQDGVTEVDRVLQGQRIPVPDSLPPGSQLKSCGTPTDGSSSSSSGSGTGPAEPATVVPATLPPSSGAQPANTDAAKAAVIAAYNAWLNGANPESVRRQVLDRVDELAPLLDQAKVGNEQATATVSVQVTDVTFQDPTHATVMYTEYLGGNPYSSNAVGYAVYVDGQWKVASQTVCAVIANAGVQCPPDLLTPR
jgi:hypothetical protein